jgi:hypothetical protein
VIFTSAGVTCPNRYTSGCDLTPELLDRVLHAYQFGDPICRCQNGYTKAEIVPVPDQALVHVALYFGGATAIRHFDLHFQFVATTWEVSDITCEEKGSDTGLFAPQLAECP